MAEQTPSHLDPSLSHFANPSFDPVDFLNATLPPLSLSLSQSQSRTSVSPPKDQPASLAALSTQTQSLLSQLSAQNARLSNTLTQLADEILRGGGRLAYEVEVLRGETVGLADALRHGDGDGDRDGLAADIGRFVTGGLDIEAGDIPPEQEQGQEQGQEQEKEDDQQQQSTTEQPPNTTTTEHPPPPPSDPLYISQLRTLSLVRSRLEDVIQTFGDAMEWPLAPSELSITSSFISVSAPEPGPENHSGEEKGREVAKKLRAEIIELLGSGDVDGAARRVEKLRELAGVWRGTAEEKARGKFVEGLARLVEERKREEERRGSPATGVDGNGNGNGREERGASGAAATNNATTATSTSTAGGLFRNLQRLRDEIYLD
ncbi:hypothetical protein FQN53_002008 [Emmonsiellopsis sp. PD_33]|nr:hypothetical protein FQN53_002008 [Emmonsiellopsis sp. PD_33]